MNSLTGVGHAVGVKTKKVIVYATRSKRCAVCYAAEKIGQLPHSHGCRQKFNKSSMAMEADAVADIAKELQSDGGEIGIMIKDDGSSAIKGLAEVAGEEVQKFSDLNHVKRNFGNWLYELKGKG